MAYENPRRERLLREALGDELRMPSAGATCFTICVVAVVVALVIAGGYMMPESNGWVHLAGHHHATYATAAGRSAPPSGY